MPAEGRAGDPPVWPLPGGSRRELELWADLWGKPQAVEWERLGMGLDVALYCRRFAEAETPGATAASVTLVKQLGEALGVSIPGMLRNRWRIGVVEVEVEGGAEVRAPVKSRFTVLDGGA